MQAGEWLALACGVVVGASIGWIFWLLNAPSRRRFDALRRELAEARRRPSSADDGKVIHLADRLERDRLVAERDAARERAQSAAESAFQAHHEVEVLRERLDASERRLDGARRSINQITAQLQVAAARRRRDPAAGSPAPGRAEPRQPMESGTSANPSDWSADLARLEAETVTLRRRLADRAIELDLLRNGPESRATNDPRFRRALDDVTDLWHDHRSRSDLVGGPLDEAVSGQAGSGGEG